MKNYYTIEENEAYEEGYLEGKYEPGQFNPKATLAGDMIEINGEQIDMEQGIKLYASLQKCLITLETQDDLKKEIRR